MLVVTFRPSVALSIYKQGSVILIRPSVVLYTSIEIYECRFVCRPGVALIMASHSYTLIGRLPSSLTRSLETSERDACDGDMM